MFMLLAVSLDFHGTWWRDLLFPWPPNHCVDVSVFLVSFLRRVEIQAQMWSDLKQKPTRKSSAWLQKLIKLHLRYSSLRSSPMHGKHTWVTLALTVVFSLIVVVVISLQLCRYVAVHKIAHGHVLKKMQLRNGVCSSGLPSLGSSH